MAETPSRVPAFRRFWTARLVSTGGDQVARTALLIAVFDRHGAAAVGLFLLAATVPRLFGPILGTLADQFDQRRVIVACDVGQAVVYAALAVLSPALPVLLVLVAVASVGATTFTPAGRSLLPNLVGTDRLGAANAQLAVGVNAGLAAGPALGGLLLATVGLGATLLVDAATFVMSAALIGGIGGLAAPAAAGGRRPFRSVLGEGLGVVRRDAVVRTVALGFFVMVVFAALDNVALVPFGRGVLHSGDFPVGLLLTGYGVFMVLGPMALGRLGGRIRMEPVLYAAYLALGAGTVLSGLSPVIAVAFVGQAIAGAGAGWCHIAVDTLIQQHVPARSLGTVFGTVYIFPYAAEVLTYLAGAGVVATAGARSTLLISGIGVLATLALVAPALSRAERPASRTGDPERGTLDSGIGSANRHG